MNPAAAADRKVRERLHALNTARVRADRAANALARLHDDEDSRARSDRDEAKDWDVFLREQAAAAHAHLANVTHTARLKPGKNAEPIVPRAAHDGDLEGVVARLHNHQRSFDLTAAIFGATRPGGGSTSRVPGLALAPVLFVLVAQLLYGNVYGVFATTVLAVLVAVPTAVIRKAVARRNGPSLPAESLVLLTPIPMAFLTPGVDTNPFASFGAAALACLLAVGSARTLTAYRNDN